RLEVELLFRSLRRRGGHLARARCAAKFVGTVNRAVAQRLDALEVEVDVVQRVDPRSPHANKIRMLEGAGDVGFLVALDNDVARSRDLSSYLDPARVGAKPEDLDPLTFPQWVHLFDYLRLEIPPERFRTTFTWAETIPYFNTGVLLLPGRHVEAIHDS